MVYPMEIEIIIRFFLASLWGGLVGAEREYHGKSAGFRTMIMISLGSCFFTMMSQWIGGINNPDRIAANVVTGIGFLGAGVIFRGENRINGITTAATIWTVAAVGMGIGAGYYFAAAIASTAVIFILAILPYLEKMIDKMNQLKVYTIQCSYSSEVIALLESKLTQYQLKFKMTKMVKEETILTIEFQARGSVKLHQQFISAMLQDNAFQKFQYS